MHPAYGFPGILNKWELINILHFKKFITLFGWRLVAHLNFVNNLSYNSSTGITTQLGSDWR